MHRLRFSLLATGTAVGLGSTAYIFALEPRKKSADPYCLLLSGDCGGTNTRLSLYSIPRDATANAGQRAPGELLSDRKYRNSEFKDIGEIVRHFLQESGVDAPAAACFACAGPIVENTVNFTNNHWKIDGGALQTELGIKRVELINDFVAQGYGLLTVSDEECTVINEAPVVPGAPIACIGAGTGLGECYLAGNGHGSYTCYASEGGHAEFHPRDALEVELLQFLQNRFSERHRISVERVVSGPGIAAIYEFLRQHRDYQATIDPNIDEQFNQAGDHQAAIVAEHSESNVACRKAIDIFIAHYGAEAGVAALKWLPKAGLYLSGGIGAKNPHWITSETFKAALYDKGRLTPAVRSVPIKLVKTDDVGERGAHWAGFHVLQDVRKAVKNTH